MNLFSARLIPASNTCCYQRFNGDNLNDRSFDVSATPRNGARTVVTNAIMTATKSRPLFGGQTLWSPTDLKRAITLSNTSLSEQHAHPWEAQAMPVHPTAVSGCPMNAYGSCPVWGRFVVLQRVLLWLANSNRLAKSANTLAGFLKLSATPNVLVRRQTPLVLVCLEKIAAAPELCSKFTPRFDSWAFITMARLCRW